MTEGRGLVAITGANGMIGYASVLHALRSGYHVRCVVRREAAITYIKRGPSHQSSNDRIEYAIVPDNTVPGAYNEALSGAKYVVHVAGVWPKPHYHPDDEIYHPFVKSMQNLLSAAEKAGTVRRVVFTQAGAALVNPEDGDTLGTGMEQVLDEHVKVNTQSTAFRPPLPSPHHAYCGAKAYCMSYLQSLKQEGKCPFSIIQIIPGTVVGPSELVTSEAEAYAQMDRMSKALLFAEPRPRYAFGFVHVDDCAKVHINVLDEGKVLDEELERVEWFIAAATTEEGKSAEKIWGEVGNMVEGRFTTEVQKGVFKVGRDNLPVNMPFRVDSRVTERMLLRDGQRFRGFEECVKEVGEWYVGLLEGQKEYGKR